MAIFFLSWDESIVKVPPRLDMQVWDADSFSKVSSLHFFYFLFKDDFLGFIISFQLSSTA